MEIRQRTEMRRLMVPALRQSLKILTLPLPDLQALVAQELEDNPVLEEAQAKDDLEKAKDFEKLEEYLGPSPALPKASKEIDPETRINLLTRNVSLQDMLLRQLGMFTETDEDLLIGQEIIGNINDDGYLKATLEEIADILKAPVSKVEKVLKLIQQFEPAGVACRSVSECLLIQLELSGEKDQLLKKVIEFHLDDVAKKNYSRIAKALKEPLDKIEPIIKKITKLNPKPGRNFSLDEIHNIIPDITIDDQGEDFKIIINNEAIPTISINRTYVEMLKKGKLDPAAREFITSKLNNAKELFRAITKRQHTLRKVVEVICEIQNEAIRDGLEFLKPLTFKEVAQKVDTHETTICRVVMNKYAKTPCGVVALKDFFCSHIHSHSGESISSSRVKGLIKDLTGQEDKKQPLSDEDIVRILKEKHNLKVARRTVAKYREELKILSSTFRRVR